MSKQKLSKNYKYLIEKKAAGQALNVDTNLKDDELAFIVEPNFLKDSLYSRCKIFNISRSGVVQPKFNTSNANDSSIYGGRAYWVDEAEDIEKTKTAYTKSTITLNQLAIKVPVTNEILADAEYLPSYVNSESSKYIKYQTDRAIIYGNGNLSMGGVVGTSDQATKYVSKGVSWHATVLAMMGYYYGGKDGIWVVSNNFWQEMLVEFDADYMLDMQNGTFYLFGYPVYRMPAGNDDCLLLGDFGEYNIYQKEIRRDISEHIYFDTDQSCYRTIARLNGDCNWSAGSTTGDGSVVYPFVALGDMEEEEASSEEWNESSSSSSSSSEDYSESSSSSSTQSSSSSEDYSESSSSSDND